MTDYDILAEELLHKLCENSRLRYRRCLNDFTQGEFSILTVLSSSSGGMSPGNLCEILGMTTPRMSAAITNLRKKGYVFSKTDPSDRRKMIISITDEGHALVSSKHKEISEFISDVLSKLGQKDSEEYLRILCKINEVASLGT